MSATPHPKTPEQEADLAAPCRQYSWTPEVHDLYGAPESILNKMDSHNMELTERRIFVLLTESENLAQVRFFEQVKGKEYAVSAWTGESLGGAGGAIGETILKNKGINCVGEQVRGLLAGFPMAAPATVPAPANARAAFAHTVRAHGEGTFTRATFALLC
ncbi:MULTISPECIES: hypothetical protein [Streptomyces]|uniref:Uncharacterized protein n=3 Tax=Streptomyces rimosus TaxID=1927 RepID=A0A8A1UGA8_STRR1|nr:MULTISPECIES: hypothetical protein [Streptomyces]MYT48554.1 hypothetical protein [Streptomyces sp. SID5471]QGY66464.1 hypothetical protein V519_011560 [Streptomyces rimosus R6-500]QST79560.1 hypothetical protein SRIM_004655 [Streptomyces rimosus subsp. rimosus ATCC 10970]QTL90543.1 hypothetical protein FMM49_36865 [Streptomyces rimosus subsp. rimosus]UNZ07661.1 hypothetical protein SRIMR7_36455 [Streptomyces rimosus subsp. rimosus]